MKNDKIASVDMFRGIAILMVILVHSSQLIYPFGYSFLAEISVYGQYGVQMFFLVSALTLSISYDKRHLNDTKLNFYIRRYFRIAPAYYVALLIYLLGFTFINNNPTAINPYTPLNIIANLGLFHGFVESANNLVVPGGWSVGTEMIFYLLFPYIFYLCKKLITKNRIYIYILPIASFIISITINYLLSKMGLISFKTDFSHLLFTNQFTVFIIGICLYFNYSNFKPNITKIIISFIIFIILSYIAYIGFMPRFSQRLPYIFFALFPTIAGLSFYFLYYIVDSLKIRNNLIVTIGRLSFSIYLVHSFIIKYFLLQSGFTSWLYNLGININIMTVLVFVITVILSVVLARVIFYPIENFGINLGKKLIKRLDKNNTSQ